MNKKVLWAIRFMAVCVAGIVALQFFYSVQNYAIEKRSFSKNVNDAFKASVDSSFSRRADEIAEQFRTWISDTTFIKITCRVNPVEHVSVFTMAEVRPPFTSQNTSSLSIETFRERVPSITPKARAVLIDHTVETVRADVRKGFVFYYTKKLGDSLNKARFSVPIDTAIVRNEFKRELRKRNIAIDFSLNPERKGDFTTDQANLALTLHSKPRWIKATVLDGNLFIFESMKWAIFGSAILVLLTFFCFGYTLKLLFTQEKLSVIKDDFINNMTHELHTPLTSIIVTAESLQKFPHDEQTRNRYLDIILHQSKRLDALSSEILTSARLQKKGVESLQSVKVRALILDAISLFPEVDVVFDPDFLPEKTTIKGNYDHLLRMLQNLIDNAVKYAKSQDLKVIILASVSKNNLQLSISDNGPGIPDFEKTRIFDAFYRIQNQNVHDVKGYGLGLHYVRKIVESHGGKISVSDAPNRGTTFLISLPI
ncbi:MAG: HAMP domain-containing histidine kinase [Flavobacterium sp.]|uniref:sensor histidine kinase n=1 Tax=Flavobacterium sp. TaxID=239 RepID=UPI0012026B87|nr:HAMP domain-containing sensor histidine kinase [Flavobacterium sp.]RZJ64347.1 MAG: HAMP domain-containing histidine kinase [Flavobacterium sp.]